MKSNNYKKIKSALYNELNSSNYNYLFPDLIKKLISQGTLDNLIVHINNTKTITNTKCINNTKKGYLTGNEQFLILLENFINQFQNDFFFLNKTRDFLVEVILQDKNNNKYLLCKKYIYDNQYMYFFQYNYRKLVISGFFTNLKKLSKSSSLVQKLINDNQIKITQEALLSKRKVNLLFKLLQDLSLCNYNFFNISLLFEDIDKHINCQSKTYNINILKLKNKTYEFYITQWEMMIQNYYKKINAVKTIFKDN